MEFTTKTAIADAIQKTDNLSSAWVDVTAPLSWCWNDDDDLVMVTSTKAVK
jgi:hypothetical protein